MVSGRSLPALIAEIEDASEQDSLHDTLRLHHPHIDPAVEVEMKDMAQVDQLDWETALYRVRTKRRREGVPFPTLEQIEGYPAPTLADAHSLDRNEADRADLNTYADMVVTASM